MSPGAPLRAGLAPVEVSLFDLPTADGGWVEVATFAHPPAADTDTAIIYLHGKGGNFYGLPFRTVAPRIALSNVLHLSLNMRTHDLGYTQTDVPAADSVVEPDVAVAGGWWEDTEQGAHDLGAAVEHARRMGCRRVFLVAHSAGGFYAARYAQRDPSIDGIVMLSPLTSNKTNLGMWFPDAGDKDRATAHAQRLVDSGLGHHIIPIPAWFYGVSARTLLQRAAEPDGVWERALEAARVPLLVLWGSKESRGPLFRRLLEALDYDAVAMEELAGCDHNYIGFESAVAQRVEGFVRADGRPGDR